MNFKKIADTSFNWELDKVFFLISILSGLKDNDMIHVIL